jgi:hypothetical protein
LTTDQVADQVIEAPARPLNLGPADHCEFATGAKFRTDGEHLASEMAKTNANFVRQAVLFHRVTIGAAKQAAAVPSRP